MKKKGQKERLKPLSFYGLDPRDVIREWRGNNQAHLYLTGPEGSSCAVLRSTLFSGAKFIKIEPQQGAVFKSRAKILLKSHMLCFQVLDKFLGLGEASRGQNPF